MIRHGELIAEREQVERYRVGAATAMLMAASAGLKKGGEMWQPGDVFPELLPAAREVDARNDSQSILQKFLIMAQKSKVH